MQSMTTDVNRPKSAADNSSLHPSILHPLFFDTHAHLDQEEFDADRGEVIARAREAGVETDAVRRRFRRSRAGPCYGWPRNTACAPPSAFIPTRRPRPLPDDWSEIETLAGRPRVVALGETGLDRYRDFAPLTLQQEYLDRHLSLSRETDLPVIIHCRDAQADLLPMLRAAAARRPAARRAARLQRRRRFRRRMPGLGALSQFCRQRDLLEQEVRAASGGCRGRARRSAAGRDRQSLSRAAGVSRPSSSGTSRPTWSRRPRFLPDLRGVPVEQLAAATTANARRLFRLPENRG